MSGAIFSDSWFRVANVRVALLPSVKVQPQQFRGATWYVLQDTWSQKFFRITPKAHAFVRALSPDKTVEEVWNDFLRDHPEDAPGQEEVVQLLSQLHVANLLYFSNQPDVEAMFQRVSKQRRREFAGKLLSFLYLRIPLWNPDRWLDSIPGLIRFTTGPFMALLWLLVVALGATAVLENWQALADHSQGLFALSNLPWLYLSLAGLKLIHEFGHAFFCKRYGGSVQTFGLMLLVTTPLPYVDTTATWAFPNRWHRALVSAAGMMVEFFAAALGALVWANTGPGLINSLAFNVMVVGSVSSLIFNGNPLLRFDAYYILSDLIEIPNLYQKAQNQWLYFADRYLLGTRDAESPATDSREWGWLTGYGLASFIYRWVVTVGIVLFVLDTWFWIGVVMLLITLVTMILMPLWRGLTHLGSGKTRRNRARAVAVCTAIPATLLAVGLLVPLPYSIKASGVLRAKESATLYAITDGTLTRLAARTGESVAPQQLLLQMENRELDQALHSVREELRELQSIERLALVKASADLLSTRHKADALLRRIADLETQRAQLSVRAPLAGDWVAPELEEKQGAWVARGQNLGEVIDRRGFRFIAVVPQEQADEIFRQPIKHAELRFKGQAESPVSVREFTLIPFERSRLNSAALGWLGGGDIRVKPDDRSGEQAAEAFFEIHFLLPPQSAGPRMLHGMSGVVRIPLPDRPLFWQWGRALRQMLQKRYGVLA